MSASPQTEWRRVVKAPGSDAVHLASGWYDDEALARSLLNDEYPRPTSTGWVYELQARSVGPIVVVA